ncbi:hypothetical protein K440DRAFT_92936 [Wilcoxina mikolae CBS 423.85]|nr:hypothetical protein K440DRAFT_92936 [Wilcoxina mikolae CBS 423.85]
MIYSKLSDIDTNVWSTVSKIRAGGRDLAPLKMIRMHICKRRHNWEGFAWVSFFFPFRWVKADREAGFFFSSAERAPPSPPPPPPPHSSLQFTMFNTVVIQKDYKFGKKKTPPRVRWHWARGHCLNPQFREKLKPWLWFAGQRVALILAGRRGPCKFWMKEFLHAVHTPAQNERPVYLKHTLFTCLLGLRSLTGIRTVSSWHIQGFQFHLVMVKRFER